MLRWVDTAIPVGFYHGLYALGVGGAPSGTIVTLFQQGTATDTTAFPKYVAMKCTLIVVHKKKCNRCSTNLVIGCLRSSGLVPQTTNANTNDELNNTHAQILAISCVDEHVAKQPTEDEMAIVLS